MNGDWRKKGVLVIDSEAKHYNLEGEVKDVDEVMVYVRFPSLGDEEEWYWPDQIKPLPENTSDCQRWQRPEGWQRPEA